jgi:hypothetical protein
MMAEWWLLQETDGKLLVPNARGLSACLVAALLPQLADHDHAQPHHKTSSSHEPRNVLARSSCAPRVFLLPLHAAALGMALPYRTKLQTSRADAGNSLVFWYQEILQTSYKERDNKKMIFLKPTRMWLMIRPTARQLLGNLKTVQ